MFVDTQVYYDSAFYYSKKANKLAKKHTLVLEQAQTLFDIGMVYGSIEEWDKALDYYQQAAEFCKQGDIKRGLSSAYNNIGAIYVEQKKYELAHQYYTLAFKLAIEISDQNSIAVAYLNLGEISFFKGDLKKSKLQIEKSLRIFDSIGYTPPSAYTFIAKTYKDLNEIDRAETNALRGYRLSQKEGDLKYSYENARTLSEVFAAKENFKEANYYTNQAMLYNDTIVSSKKLNEVEKLELRSMLSEQDEKLNRLEEKNKYLTTIYILVGIGVLLLIILVTRQLKIARMTKNIHDIQNRLIKSELDLRDKKGSSTYDATVAGDKNNTEGIF